jgi:magnesium-transporting ATPase (P-type)
VFDADSGPVPADGEFRERYLAENQRLGEQGLRVLGTARKDFEPALFDPGADLLPLLTGLELLSLVGIVDPPRPTAKASIATAQAAGIRVRMITGDHAVTAAAIAGQLGIGGKVITGAEFAGLSDAEAGAAIGEVGVIARVTPEDKVRLVDVLKTGGEVVAMTGDGVNDVLALKDADLGVAMGSGACATRSVARIVLLDDDFAVLPAVVAEGRRVLGNIERVANLFLTKTFYSVALALALGVAGLPFPFLPRHVTLIGTLTIGIPGFFLALAPNTRRATPGFVPRVLRFAVPAGLLCAAATFGRTGWCGRAV